MSLTRGERTVVYVFEAEVSGMLKIGHCRPGNQHRRLQSAQRAIGERCHQWCLLDIPERTAHQKLAHARRWYEWFEPTPEAIKYIHDHAQR